MDTVRLLGLDFDDVDLPTAAALLLARSPAQKFAYVVTPNADHLARLRRQKMLQTLYSEALLCLLDSRLIYNLAGILRLPRPQVVTGVALTAFLLTRLAAERVAVVGLAAADFCALQARYPQVDFVHHQPPMVLADNLAAFAAARDFVVAARAPFVFIGLGAPLQERLACAIAQVPGATGVGLCIGAALEFCAHRARRAPSWMQAAGLEWSWRLAREPRRLARRYLRDDPPVLLALLSAALKKPS